MNPLDSHNAMDAPGEFPREELLRFLDSRSSGNSFSGPNPDKDSEAMGVDYLPANCPPADSCLRLATGEATGEEAELLLAHVAECGACGRELAESLAALEGNPSEEEAAAIQELAASRADWQRKMAIRMAATPVRGHSRFPVSGFGSRFGSRTGRWLMAGAVAAGVAGIGAFVLWQGRARNPEHELALAYSEARTLELRIPGGGYAGIHAGAHTRGGAGDNEAPALLEARARLARSLEKSPQDTRTLELEARADVLAERYDTATEVLTRLLAAGPVTAELLTDAASAYYQRGLVSGSELDRSTALDYLRRADEMAPTDPVVLFNEAIVMEDRGQMMNAVEVWNRYITVERDAAWAAEGKHKLAALEQALNRLKSHEGRINQMLGSPMAMNALAGDPARLAQLDEELSSVQLDKLLRVAYPVAASGASGSDAGLARGSPCDEKCIATRNLLKAIASSLELHHQDFWLSDLLSPDIDALPAPTAVVYAEAMQALARAMRENQTGSRAIGTQQAAAAHKLFLELMTHSNANDVMRKVGKAGERRAGVEHLYGLQRSVDFVGCRDFARELRADAEAEGEAGHYPWIASQAAVTEQVCDDTPETRDAGRKLGMASLHMTEAAHYSLLRSRVIMRRAGAAWDQGDDELAEQIAMATLRELVAEDAPLFRILDAFGGITESENESPRPYAIESALREIVQWHELTGNWIAAAAEHMQLAQAEIRIGAIDEGEKQIQMAYRESNTAHPGKAGGIEFGESEVFLAGLMLERGDLTKGADFLNRAEIHLKNNSDNWTLRSYAAERGLLELARGRLDQAAKALESDIQNSEGRNVRGGDQKTVVEYAQQDHDLYAELAATWLAQGRSAESVLALWERFRLRSRGLPITQCAGGALDCEQPRLTAALKMLGDETIAGQVLLLDRVLVYRVDRNGVRWEQRQLRRQDILDSAQKLEQAVSSPVTSLETASQLGKNLTYALLPSLPDASGTNQASLHPVMLEPDPMLQNLSWAVLPMAAGPLGLQYPLVELRSFLTASGASGHSHGGPDLRAGGRALVVGASVASEGEPPLPEALTESRSVGGFLHAPELLLGEQATRTRVADALGAATVFHFAGHALQSVNGTELLLAPESAGERSPWVDGAFLRQHPPRECRLAVLSACATGRHETSWKHPMQDIVETFNSLGVPEVVATRWEVDSEASVPLMSAFYQSMHNGNSTAVALTFARRVQFGSSRYKNPYFWAAYYVSGNRDNSM